MSVGTFRSMVVLAWCAACSSAPRSEETSVGATGASTVGGTSPTTTDTSEPSSTTGEETGADDETSDIVLDVGSDGTGGTIPEIAEVFGHSADTLYRMDPKTKAVEVVGTFAGCGGSVIDIALDADSEMYGTTYGALYRIDRETAECTMIAEGSYPTSLSFVPAGTVDADEEALVGYVDEQYIRIDVETGAITPLGSLSGGLASSGDLVSVKGGGTWLTVEGPGCEVTDCIVELDPITGSLLKNYGPLPYDEVFGLAFWAGKAYGFARRGQLFEIDFLGDSVLTTLIEIPGAPANLEFFGAGSTTSAPPAAG